MTVLRALAARDLRHLTPGGDVLLRDANLDLDNGSVLAIAGPNGAGKTTLLNLLSGAVDPAFGEVHVAGKSLREMSAIQRARHIAVVGQQEMPDGRLALREYVAMGQIPIQADRSAAAHARALEEVLELTGLIGFAEKKMATLSGGERQRAHIARALAQRPSLLFLDEPTNHLDPDAKGRMLSLVTELGITVVMIVHDIVLIPEFASQVALMKSGELVAFGPVSEVLTPKRVHDTFGVEYLQLRHEGRMIPALDIRKVLRSSDTRRPIS
ncbi:MAG: ABC transporter ATP-binding protein [Paracoccaceae bacterium]